MTRRSTESTYTVKKAVAIKATDAALLISAPEFEKDQWVPRSQIHFHRADRM